jgi:hypothetical protein
MKPTMHLRFVERPTRWENGYLIQGAKTLQQWFQDEHCAMNGYWQDVLLEENEYRYPNPEIFQSK